MADGFKSTLNKGVTALNVKTSSMLETAKLKTHINTLGADIDRLTTALGNAVYQSWLSGKESAEVSPLCESIREKQLEIEGLRQKIKDVEQESKKIFGSKSMGNPGDLPPQPPAPAPAYICPNCGTSYGAPINFCTKCGAKMV